MILYSILIITLKKLHHPPWGGIREGDRKSLSEKKHHLKVITYLFEEDSHCLKMATKL